MNLKRVNGKILLAGLFSTGMLIGCLSSGDTSTNSTTDASLRFKGAADDSADWGKGGVGKQTICHIPPGNPGNAHTICVGIAAVRAHMDHGDKIGACPDSLHSTDHGGKIHGGGMDSTWHHHDDDDSIGHHDTDKDSIGHHDTDKDSSGHTGSNCKNHGGDTDSTEHHTGGTDSTGHHTGGKDSTGTVIPPVNNT